MKRFLILLAVTMISCVDDEDGPKETSKKLDGIYEVTGKYLDAVTIDKIPKNIPRWYAIADSVHFFSFLEFMADSGYFVETGFGTCKKYGFTQGNAVYALKDTVLTIKEKNNYGSFGAEYNVHMRDSLTCSF